VLLPDLRGQLAGPAAARWRSCRIHIAVLSCAQATTCPSTAYGHLLPVVAYCMLPIACPVAYCLLPAAYCLLPAAYCLLHIACCLYCLLPIAYCLLPAAYCLLPAGSRAGAAAAARRSSSAEALLARSLELLLLLQLPRRLLVRWAHYVTSSCWHLALALTAIAAAASAFCLLLELLAPLGRHLAGPEPAHGLAARIRLVRGAPASNLPPAPPLALVQPASNLY
jgi:hypothetical protein